MERTGEEVQAGRQAGPVWLTVRSISSGVFSMIGTTSSSSYLDSTHITDMYRLP